MKARRPKAVEGVAGLGNTEESKRFPLENGLTWNNRWANRFNLTLNSVRMSNHNYCSVKNNPDKTDHACAWRKHWFVYYSWEVDSPVAG